MAEAIMRLLEQDREEKNLLSRMQWQDRDEAERRQSERCGIKGRLQHQTFARFEVNEENGAAFRAAKWYADHFPEMRATWANGRLGEPVRKRNGLYISGSYGTGKTHLAAAIGNQLLGQGTELIFTTVLDLLDGVRASFDSCYAAYAPKERDLMRRYVETPVLILDDVGSEQPTEWGVATIYAMINARYEMYRPVIITTNYSDQELVYRMTPPKGDPRNVEKTIDRLMEVCGGIELYGESWRTK